MRIAGIPVGAGSPLVLLAGLNVIEAEEACLEMAAALAERAGRHGFPLVFKASFDKANRSSVRSYRGPGLDEGLRILGRVKRELGLPIRYAGIGERPEDLRVFDPEAFVDALLPASLGQ